MKINTFDLEKKLHALNQALLYKKTEVIVNFTERPEDRSYQCTFTQEFLEDIESLIAENTAPVYVLIGYGPEGSEECVDYRICDEKTDYDSVFQAIRLANAVPIKFHTLRSDNYMDVELLYRMIKAAECCEKGKLITDMAKPIELFPYYKK